MALDWARGPDVHRPVGASADGETGEPMPVAISSNAGRRFAVALRDDFPGDTEWRIADAFGLDPETSRSWLLGTLPSLPDLERIIRRQGPEFARRVFPSPNASLWHRWFDLARAVAAHRRKIGQFRRMMDDLECRCAGLVRANPVHVIHPAFLGLWLRDCRLRLDLVMMEFDLWKSRRFLNHIFRRLVERGSAWSPADRKATP